jgi:hypothetical protein
MPQFDSLPTTDAVPHDDLSREEVLQLVDKLDENQRTARLKGIVAPAHFKT